jgi:DNA-binding NarL/FixJ family response regulator
VVVMDLAMPVMDGIQAARSIMRLAPATSILMLSMSAAETSVRNAFEAGVQGYLLKNALDLDLRGAVKAVAMRKRVLDLGPAGSTARCAPR